MIPTLRIELSMTPFLSGNAGLLGVRGATIVHVGDPDLWRVGDYPPFFESCACG